MNGVKTDISGLQSSFVEGMVEKRVFESFSGDIEKYIANLEENPVELGLLVNYLHVNYTKFFRNPIVFEYLASFVLPDLIRQKVDNDEGIRIWSAGCSTGEEPYSLALTLLDLFHNLKVKIPVSIFATDINNSSLQQAQKGIFSSRSIANTKYHFIEKYFTKQGGGFAIGQEVRDLVVFEKYDVADSYSYSPPSSIFGSFDLVACRNVLIYFNDESVGNAVTKFHRSLLQGGTLMLGNTEYIPAALVSKFNKINKDIPLYRKM